MLCVFFSCCHLLNPNNIFHRDSRSKYGIDLSQTGESTFNTSAGADINEGSNTNPTRCEKNSKLGEPSIRNWWHFRKRQDRRVTKKNFTILSPVSYSHLDKNNLTKCENSAAKVALDDAILSFDSGRYELAKFYYEKAAMEGELIAIHNLGIMFLHGQGIPTDHKRAIECFILCSSYDIPESMAELGYIYMNGKGVEKDYKKARQWFENVTERHEEPYSQYNLAVIHLKGLGCPVDQNTGIYWLKKSAINGYLPAIYNLANICAENEGNEELAVALYKETAIRMNDAFSQNNLGIFYMTGKNGVNKNESKGLRFFQLAANQGVSEAFYNIGKAYLQGHGIRKSDTVKSAQYFYQAAKLKPNCDAEFNLGCIFWEGDECGIKPNLSVALYWFESAAKKGHMGARNNVMELRKLTRERQMKKLAKLQSCKHHIRHVYDTTAMEI